MLAVVLGVLLPAGLPQEGAAAGPPSGGTRIVLIRSPVLDLWSLVRAHASPRGRFAGEREPPGAPAWPPFAAAVEAARALEEDLGHPLAWGMVEGLLWDCRTGAEVRARLAELPEEFDVLGESVALRAGALRLADALLAVEEEYLAGLWPEHERLLGEAGERIERRLRPREAECFRFIRESFEMPDPAQALPVVLVVAAPPPGGITHRRRPLAGAGGRPAGLPAGPGGVSFVAVGGLPDGELLETLLHESLHSLEVLTRGSGSVSERLARALEAAGVDARDRRLRDATHLLLFVQAAATVRLHLDPQHRPYGETTGLYERFGEVAAAGVPLWTQVLEAERTPDEFIAEFVAALTGGT